MVACVNFLDDSRTFVLFVWPFWILLFIVSCFVIFITFFTDLTTARLSDAILIFRMVNDLL